MFQDYPDVVNPQQLGQMLGGLSKNTTYSLLHSDAIQYVKVGKKFLIPKQSVIEFLCNTN